MLKLLKNKLFAAGTYLDDKILTIIKSSIVKMISIKIQKAGLIFLVIVILGYVLIHFLKTRDSSNNITEIYFADRFTAAPIAGNNFWA